MAYYIDEEQSDLSFRIEGEKAIPKIKAELINGFTEGTVRYNVPQSLTEGQQSQARNNIGAEKAGTADTLNAVRYDKGQSLDISQMEQAMVNLGLQNFKGKLLVSDLNLLDPTWWCWGETDYFNDPSEDDAVAKDNNFFWWQSSRMVDGVLETSQTRINGRRLQRRTKTGINTAWKESWEDLDLKDIIRYDLSQDLTATQMEQAMVNLGLQNFKGKLLVSDLNLLDPTWWCWGETDYFNDPSGDDAVAKDNNFFWWQSSRMVDGVLETSQTRINGRRLQRRTKTGKDTSWSGVVWSDIDEETFRHGVELYGIEDMSSEEIDEKIGGWDNLREAIIRARNINALVDASGQWAQLTGKNQGNHTIILSDVNVEGTKTVWTIDKSQEDGSLSCQKQSFNGNVDIATSDRYGTVILGYKAGDYRDAGRVAVMDEEGKIPNVNLRDAYSNPDLGGIVKVTLNGGSSEAWKVPMINEDGRLSFSTIPLATNSLCGGVTLASNTGTSSDSGKVPVCGSNGKLPSEVLPDISPKVTVNPYQDLGKGEVVLGSSGIGWYAAYNMNLTGADLTGNIKIPKCTDAGAPQLFVLDIERYGGGTLSVNIKNSTGNTILQFSDTFSSTRKHNRVVMIAASTEEYAVLSNTTVNSF